MRREQELARSLSTPRLPRSKASSVDIAAAVSAMLAVERVTA
jgi:hypothetical protein